VRRWSILKVHVVREVQKEPWDPRDNKEGKDLQDHRENKAP